VIRGERVVRKKGALCTPSGITHDLDKLYIPSQHVRDAVWSCPYPGFTINGRSRAKMTRRPAVRRGDGFEEEDVRPPRRRLWRQDEEALARASEGQGCGDWKEEVTRMSPITPGA